MLESSLTSQKETIEPSSVQESKCQCETSENMIPRKYIPVCDGCKSRPLHSLHGPAIKTIDGLDTTVAFLLRLEANAEGS